MNVRKRGLALLMCICMIFTLLPFSALAETGVASDAEPSVSVESSGDNGVKLKKTVTKQGDDTYKVTLEQYVTGTVTQGTVTPIDVVLVLDVSGSMKDGFSSTSYVKTYEVNKYGDYYVKNPNDEYIKVSWCSESECDAFTDGCNWNWNWGWHHTPGTAYTPLKSENDNTSGAVQFYKQQTSSTSKIDSLKSAVKSFIDTIAKDSQDSKIAIVKFAGDKSEDVGNATYKKDGYTYNYTQIVKGLTSVKDGVKDLKSAVDSLNPAGSTRADYGMEKAISVFGKADNVPTDRQRVVIMFTDGEPTDLNQYDPSVANNAIKNAETLKSAAYGAKVYTIGIFSGADIGTSLPENNNAGRTNRYMHLVSSNYPTAKSMTDTGTDGAVTNGYYKVASDASTLSKAFTQIGDAVGNPAITLDSSAVLTDNVAPNFKAPSNASEVKVYTEDHNSDGSFSNRQSLANAQVSITGQNVTVTGFDYSANYVSTTAHPDNKNDFGKKLIVEFTIKVDREKTHGGTQPTNAGANIKLNNEIVAHVDNPTMPVSITNGFDCEYTNTKSYEKGVGFTIENEFKAMLVNDGLATKIADNEFKNDFVTITYEVTDKDNNPVGTYTINRNAERGTWTLAENASATTSDAVDTYVYNVTCKVTDANGGNATYKTGVADGTGTMTLTITPLNTLTVSGTDYNGVYDGQEHGTPAVAKIGDTVVTDGVTISYKVGKGEWTTKVPTVKDVADTTKVQVKAEKAGYTPAEATYTLNVTPRPIEFTASTVTRNWTGSLITVNYVADNDVTITPNRPTATVPDVGLLDGHECSFTGEVYSASGTAAGEYEGKFETTVALSIKDADDNDVTANYTAVYKPGKLIIVEPTAATVTLTAKKLLDNDLAKDSFTFVLKDKDNIIIQTKYNNENGIVSFDQLTFAEAGNHIYYISEVAGENTSIKYDETVYMVTVHVTLDTATGKYVSSVAYSKLLDDGAPAPTTDNKAVFHNTTKPTGSLTISKTVSGNAASTTKEFTFKVMLLQNANMLKGEVTYGNVKFTNGEATIKLKHNESKTITGIPAGLNYAVTESDNNGYTVTVNGINTTMATGNIKAGETSTAAFKNTKSYVYPPNPPIMDEITVEITGNSDSVVYDGAEHSVKGYTVKISDPRYTEADFTFTGKAEASGVNAGTYEMGLKAEQFKNTNARFTNVKFVIKADGVLTITPKELTITAGSKTEYGPTPVTCDEWTVSGLVAGDKVESVKITGIQSVPGSSPNVPSDAVIKNAKGEDVTKNYAIKYVNGTLTMLEVLNKEDHFNYIIGTPEGLSLPTANVTRAEVATIFFRLMTDDARAKFDSLDNNFSDVAKGKWYNRAISTLANAGIIKGDPAGTYRPGDPITRAEMAAIIARFGDFKEGGKTFNDISGHWAQKYIELAASNGWINGNPDGTFKPNNNITRAETVAMINRVLDRQTKDVSDLLPVSQMTNWSDNMDTAKWYYRDMQEATNNHKAERVGNSIYEKWTEKLPDIDWASYQI